MEEKEIVWHFYPIISCIQQLPFTNKYFTKKKEKQKILIKQRKKEINDNL